MRTARVLTGLVLVATFAAACGVAADDRAAVVLGTPVSTSTVDDLAADEAFLQAVGGGLPGTESVVPGDSARAALTFEIQRAAAETELERWGLSLDDAVVAEARGSVEQQVPPGLGDRALDELAGFVAATTALGNRLTAIDPSDEEDLRRLYDGAPSLWARTCVAVLAVAEEQAATVVDLVGSGRQVEEVAAEIVESQLVFDPADACVPTAQLPGDLREAIERATPDRRRRRSPSRARPARSRCSSEWTAGSGWGSTTRRPGSSSPRSWSASAARRPRHRRPGSGST
jgi:hypothetical protein